MTAPLAAADGLHGGARPDEAPTRAAATIVLGRRAEGLFLICSANKKITNKSANKLLVVSRDWIFRSNYGGGQNLENR